MKSNFLHLLLSTSLLATNVVPAAQPIPDIVIQAANAAIEEKSSDQSEVASMQEEVQDPTIDVVDNSPEQQVEEQTEESPEETESSQEEVQDSTTDSKESSSDQSSKENLTDEPSTETDAPQEEVKDPTLESNVGSSDPNNEEKIAESTKEERAVTASGTWGTSKWSFIESSGVLTVYAGTIGDDKTAPWNTSVSTDLVKAVEFAGGKVVAQTGERLFSGLKNMTSVIGLTYLDTSQVTSMSGMFSLCSSLSYLDSLDSLDTSKVTNIALMFMGCSSLTSLDISNFDTSNVTYMNNMFDGCSSLKSIDVSNFDTSNVTYMDRMFQNCSSLTSLDVSNFDTSKVTNMTGLFSNCSGLTSLDVSNFDTSKVTGMSRTFAGLTVKSLDLSGLDTSKVTAMTQMFMGSMNLSSLDLSNFDTSKVTNMQNMFASCGTSNKPNRLKLKLGSKSVFDSTVGLSGAWIGENSSTIYKNLQGYNGSQPDTYVRYDGVWGTSPWDFDTTTGVLTFYAGTWGKYTESPWNTQEVASARIKKIELMENIVAPADSSYLFSSSNLILSSLLEIEGLTKLDTSNVTNMRSMFQSCSSLTSLDVSNFDTSKVTDMYGMISNCRSLTSLDLSNFDTSNVANMMAMFYSCSSLTSLDVSYFDTSNVTYMNNMFLGCSSLTSLDVSNFDTSKVTSMHRLFEGCTDLASITLGSKSIFSEASGSPSGVWRGEKTKVTYATTDEFLQGYDGSQPDTYVRYDGLWGTSPYIFDEETGVLKLYAGTLGGYSESPWNTQEVARTQIRKIELMENIVAPANSSYLFSGATSTLVLSALTEIEGLNKLDTNNVTAMNNMFMGSRLTSLDLSSFVTKKVTNMSNMFRDCSGLTSLNISSLDTNNVTNTFAMFYGCSGLTSLDLNNFNTSKVTNMQGMFGNCTRLTSLDLSSFDTGNVTNMESMFSDCTSLASITLGSKSIFSEASGSPSGIWRGEKTKVTYATTDEFLQGYDGSQPDTFILMDGAWGTSPYIFDEKTGVLKLYAGTLGEYSESPWNSKAVDNLKIKKIELMENIVSPVNSSYLFSATTSGGNLASLLEIEGLNKLDTSNVTNMNGLFNGCSSLTSLDLSNFDTSKVTDMTYMFYNVRSLTSLDLSSFNTRKVTNMTQMFMGSSSLKNLDLSSFDTTEVTGMLHMFRDCTSLTSMTLGSKSIFSKATNSPAGKWKGEKTNVYYESTEQFIAEYDGSKPDTFIRFDAAYDGLWGTSPWKFDEKTGVLTFYAGTWTESPDSPWNTRAIDNTKIKKIELMETIVAPQNSQELFRDLNQMEQLVGLAYLDTSNVTDMSSMFLKCSSLTKLDVSSFKTSNLTKMANMFSGCNSLTSLDLSGFDTSEVTAMNEVFYDCNSLTNLDLSGFDTGKVIDMAYMFANCNGLTSLDLSSFDTSKVTSMTQMFEGSSSLTTLDLSNFDTSKVTSLNGMFDGCRSLKSLDLSSFDTSNVISMINTFYGCSSLTSLDLSSFDTSNVTSMIGVFTGCTDLTSITLGSKSIFARATGLPVGVWLGDKTKVIYATTNQFLTEYDGSQPDTFLRVEDSWGTSPYWFDAQTGILSVFSGTLGTSEESPWNAGKVDPSMVKKIELIGDLVAPENSSYLFSSLAPLLRVTNLTEITGLNKLDTSQVTNMSNMFDECTSLTRLDLSSFNTSKVTMDMNGMFANCTNLSILTLGKNFKVVGNSVLSLPENRWIGSTNLVRYATSSDFMTNYDGSQPDTYVWDNTAQLKLEVESQNAFVIGKKETFKWTIAHTTTDEKGNAAKSLQGKITTAEDVLFGTELSVETKNSLGETTGTTNVPLTYVGATNGKSIYEYELPNLAYGETFTLSLSVTPWNNTTISPEPTFIYDLKYESILDGKDGEISLSDSLKETTNQAIENGNLAFKELPDALVFNTEKLNPSTNGKLILREKSNWEIGISDFRGTKAQSVDDRTVSRQDWELFVTAGAFKDTNNQTIAQDALGIVYVDEQNTVHELSETTETLLFSHVVNGETPKTNNYVPVNWSEDTGIQAIVHNRNALESDKTYQADVTFELRSAP